MIAVSPRPETPIGTFGSISYEHISSRPPRYKARARYRDDHDTLKRISATGSTKKNARDALEKRLAERRVETGIGDLRSDSKVADLAAAWLADVEASNRSAGTKEQYADAVNRYILPHLGRRRIREVTTSVVDRLLGTLIDRHGPSSAKQAKSALTGMFGLAVRHDAAPVNPLRETRSIPRARRLPRALTPQEQHDITDALRASERAAELDLPDLAEFLLATGCRIGEALAVRYCDIDWKAGTVDINATVVRLRSQGLHRGPTKTGSSNRKLLLPSWCVEMIKARRDGHPGKLNDVLVFPSPKAGTLRDPHNAGGDLRDVRDSLGFPWVVWHTFRKTVATRLDEAGLSGRDVANQLGHARPSITQDTYMGRRAVNDAAAKILDR